MESGLKLSSTTVVERLAEVSRAFDRGSREHGIGVVFAMATGGADVQSRATLATAGERADGATPGR